MFAVTRLYLQVLLHCPCLGPFNSTYSPAHYDKFEIHIQKLGEFSSNVMSQCLIKVEAHAFPSNNALELQPKVPSVKTNIRDIDPNNKRVVLLSSQLSSTIVLGDLSIVRHRANERSSTLCRQADGSSVIELVVLRRRVVGPSLSS